MEFQQTHVILLMKRRFKFDKMYEILVTLHTYYLSFYNVLFDDKTRAENLLGYVIELCPDI